MASLSEFHPQNTDFQYPQNSKSHSKSPTNPNSGGDRVGVTGGGGGNGGGSGGGGGGSEEGSSRSGSRGADASSNGGERGRIQNGGRGGGGRGDGDLKDACQGEQPDTSDLKLTSTNQDLTNKVCPKSRTKTDLRKVAYALSG